MTFSIENELALLEKYKLTPTEFTTTMLLLMAQEDDKNKILFKRLMGVIPIKEVLQSLKDKGIILKDSKFESIQTIQINKNVTKQFYRAALEMGKELFEVYPQSTYVNGMFYNLKRISKHFDSVDDAFARYAKYISHNPDKHREIIELINWGKDNSFPFTTLDSFILDFGWLALEAFKKGETNNINNDAIQLI